jgi:hypothetical protein
MARNRRHSQPTGESRILSLIKEHRSEPNSHRNGVIPARGYTFDDDEVFDGIPGNRLKYHDLRSSCLRVSA